MTVMYSARQRGRSDVNVSNSSTFLSALSSTVRRSKEAAIDEEYKSDEEIMRRLPASDSESCRSGGGDKDDD